MKCNFDVNYPPARGPVLLLSCLDGRLMDEITHFMAHDGLLNRYDHLIMAGAALGALGGNCEQYQHWRTTFLDHLQTAYDLHHIHDVYILEHRDCGAYKKFLGENGTFNDEQYELEAKVHCQHAEQLSQVIYDWAKEKQIAILVKAFLMDLRGNVELLSMCDSNKLPLTASKRTPISTRKKK